MVSTKNRCTPCRYLEEAGRWVRRTVTELRRAYQDVADAKGLKVQKVPAVIVDRTYVVYGLADVAEATGLIDAYLQGEH
ncbi:MAG: DUF1525 domain-containing protein [Pseudomonas sp.]|nr:DUF1525 domain-containing protein [Pseudomonas sp.]